MNAHLLTPVMELKMIGLKPEFSGYDLEQKASSMLDDLREVLDTKSLLHYTVPSHSFRLAGGDDRGLILVVGLVFSNQFSLDLEFEPRELGKVDDMVFRDRQALVSACRELPSACDEASVEWAQIYSTACLNLPDKGVHQTVSRQVNAMLEAKHRNLEGAVADQPWQHSIEGLGKYQWSAEILQIRAQLDREKRGYKLTLLSTHNLPPSLRSVRTLRMWDRPRDLDAASFLDRSEHIKSSVEMMIRVGSKPGSDRPLVADFIGLCVATDAELIKLISHPRQQQ